MNILFLSSWYPTEINPNYGVFVKEHAAAIHIAGNKIVVLALVVHKSKKIFSVSNTDKMDENGVRTVLVEIHTRFFDIVHHAVPFQYEYLKKTYKKHIAPEFIPDAVHANVIFPAGIMGYWLAKKFKKPLFITEHWTRIERFSRQPILSSWGKIAYNYATAIMPVSHYLQRHIQTFFATEDAKFYPIGNIIDADIFQCKSKENTENEIRLCSIATWNKMKTPAKQPELLIQAINLLPENVRRKVQLTMVGGGNKLEELKALCTQLGVNAQFTGYLPKHKIANILQRSDFFVHPTLTETFGVVIAEALSTGTPVICSNVGALPELVNESNGVLCENTIEAWVDGLQKAFSTRFDNKKIAEDVSNKYSKENIGKQIADVYMKVLPRYNFD